MGVVVLTEFVKQLFFLVVQALVVVRHVGDGALLLYERGAIRVYQLPSTLHLHSILTFG